MPKRRLVDIGERVYNSLNEGPKAVSEISRECGIDWTTVNNHLRYMGVLGVVVGGRTWDISVWETI